MTHPPEAVDALARALAYVSESKWLEMVAINSILVKRHRIQARALLAEIEPRIRAAERKECAKVAHDAIRASNSPYLWALADAVSAAIRERGTK